MSKRWYVVHAYSGFEKNVARALKERVGLSELSDYFGEILVPTEEVVEMRAGQKRRSERPGKGVSPAGMPTRSSTVAGKSRSDTRSSRRRPLSAPPGSDTISGTWSRGLYKLLPWSNNPCSPNCSP